MSRLVALLHRPRLAPDGGPTPRLLGCCDEAALATALALRATDPGGHLCVVAAGPAEREDELLHHALARGADQVIRVWDAGLEGVDYLGIASVLAAAVRRLGFDLVLGGDRSDDEGDGAVGPAVAEALGVPHVSTALRVALDGGAARVARRDGGQLRTLRLKLPALVTVLRGPSDGATTGAVTGGAVTVLGLEALGLHAPELRPRQHCLGAASPVEPTRPTLLGRADELIARLRHDHLLDP